MAARVLVNRVRARQRMVLVALALAVIWWLAALYVRSTGIAPVWYDQSITFARRYDLSNPYLVSSFIYPPWAAFFFNLFGVFSLPVATLVQTCLHFTILALVIVKFGGGMRAVILSLTSFIAFDATLELNIEWIVYLGLLLPPAFSGPFLLIKPQSAFGYWLGLERQVLVRALLVLLATVLVSLLLWGLWPLAMWEGIRVNTLSRAIHDFNIAPMAQLPLPLSLAIGLVLAYCAFRRRDPALGIFAWLFFVPYIAFYSLMLPFALVCARWPRVALVVSGAMWLVYGGVLARFFLSI